MVECNSGRDQAVKDQPFYHLLAENDEQAYIAYVSEQNLIHDDSEVALKTRRCSRSSIGTERPVEAKGNSGALTEAAVRK